MDKKLRRVLRAPALILHWFNRGISLLRLQGLYLQAYMNGGKISASPTVTVKHPVRFQGHGRLIVEKNVTFGFHLAGANNIPILIQPRESDSFICIGKGSMIMNGCEFIARTSIQIGERCLIGSQVNIIDADFHGIVPNERNQPGKTNPVIIEDNVWVGIRAMILKGVHIGKDAVIAAGCVVTKDVPDGAIVAGNPMCIVGSAYSKPESRRQLT